MTRYQHSPTSVVKVATVIKGCIAEEQCSVVCFLLAKSLNAKDIYKKMFPAYGGKCLSRKTVHSWVEKFSQGRSKVADDARLVHILETATEATAVGGRVDSS
jgi:hypothetical protein